VRELEDVVAALLKEAVEVGRIKSDAGVNILARLILTTYNGTIMTWAMVGDTNLEAELERNLHIVIQPYLTNPESIKGSPIS
jgi:hypothetical protein